MTLLTRSLRAKFLVLFALVPLLILSACGGSSGTTSPSGTTTPAKVPVTVGSKLDPEAQLLGEMSAYDPSKDYDTVKNGFEQQYHITWLDQAPLNDGYALCMSKSESQKLGVTNLSQLAPKVSQLTLATQSDGVPFFDSLKATYGFATSNFKAVKKVDYAIGFAALNSGAAQVTECYTTDGSVTTKNFVFLEDDKNGFPQFHPAPIVRDSVLQSDPGIKDALNPLAPDLTTDVSIMLQQQVNTKHTAGEPISQAVKEVAMAFLQSKGLL